MAKLYPPRIPSTIPAFIKKGTDDTVISVPFFLNRLTGIGEIGGFILKVKTAITNDLLFTTSITVDNISEFNSETGSGVIDFLVPAADYNKLYKGQFYKVQMANYDITDIEHTNLYYSDVAIVKMTGNISADIEKLKMPADENEKEYNFAIQELVGVYSNDDITEKLYSSRFIIYDMFGDIYEDSGEIIQNNALQGEVLYYDGTMPDRYRTTQSYTRVREMDESQFYYVEWQYTTVNGYKNVTSKYPIAQKTLMPELKAKLIAELNFENGYIDLSIEAITDETEISKTEIGNYLVTRHSSKYPGEWLEIYRFDLREEIPTRHLWIDNTVEQGITYTYGIQQYSKHKIYTKRIESNPVVADFEHAYLSDSDRQLKIAFNPKISSFKPVILETKTDTIGGKYPFIFRNGDVYYHELPLSGLISCQLDDSNLFTNKDELSLIAGQLEKVTDPSAKVITEERLFKREVLSWLTNGKPKLLRTPAEGNFIVRLMNVSLSPMDQLGRMLHTFSATAYEIENYSFKNIVNMNLLNKLQEDIDTSFVYESINLAELTTAMNNDAILRQMPLRITNNEGIIQYKIGNAALSEEEKIEGVYSVQFTDMTPGTTFEISYDTNGITNVLEIEDTKTTDANAIDGKRNRFYNDSPRTIMINVTGTYSYFSDIPFIVSGNKQTQGVLTFSYRSKRTNSFEDISNITIYHKDGAVISSDDGKNIIEQLTGNDDNKQVSTFYRMNFFKKKDGLSFDDYNVKIVYVNDQNPSEFNIFYNPIFLDNMFNIAEIYIGSGVYADLSYELIKITRV